MQYSIYEENLSAPRLKRYKNACNENREQAVELYKLNILLSLRLYGYLSIFEVVLRNRVDRHLRNQYKNQSYLKDQLDDPKGFLHEKKLNSQKMKVESAIIDIKRSGLSFSHERLVAALSFGFWTEMFGKYSFLAVRRTLLNIFPKKPSQTNRDDIYAILTRIRKIRNKIAHHEPICFRVKTQNNIIVTEITTERATQLLDDITRLYSYMNINYKDLINDLPNPIEAIEKIENLRSEI